MGHISSKRDLQNFCSLLEEAYKEPQYPSLSNAIIKESELSHSSTNKELYIHLKRKYGPPTGKIERVVTKQFYNYLICQEDLKFVCEYIETLATEYSHNPATISDDQLVRGLR